MVRLKNALQKHSNFKNTTAFELNISVKRMHWNVYTVAYEIYSRTVLLFPHYDSCRVIFTDIFQPASHDFYKVNATTEREPFFFIDIQTFSELDKFPKFLKHPHNFTHFSTRNSYSRISVPHIEIHTYLRCSQASALENLGAQ